MILTVDIGNTTIALGSTNHLKVKSVQRIDTSSSKEQLSIEFKRILRAFYRKGLIPKMAVISSVVPKITSFVVQIIRKELDIDVKVVGSDIIVPIVNRYKNPKQVGQDRLVGAYAALKLYGAPIIVIDLGTAITFDVISAKQEYLGGIIVPGLRLSAESLFLKTALLPKIDIKAPRSVIGRTTEESILSGLFYGYGSLCQGFIERIARQIKARPKVVMTGGHIQLMKNFIAPQIRIIDENLVHKGLGFLADLKSEC